MTDFQAPTSRHLLLSLQKLLADSLAGYDFPASDGLKSCGVYQYGLPDDLEANNYPFIVLRFLDGIVSEGNSQTTQIVDTIGLGLGVYAPKDLQEAGVLLAELIDYVRRVLWRERVLAKMFQVFDSIKTSIPNADMRWHEYHLATIEAKFQYAQPGAGWPQYAQQFKWFK